MNTRTLGYSFWVVFALVSVIAVFGGTFLAHADTPPTIATSIVTGSGVPVTSAAIGSSVQDSVQIASSTATTPPTGTVTFNLYNNGSCVGTPTTQSGIALMSGAATSSATTVPASGLSYLVNYSGDASNTPVNSVCESLAATASNTALSTTLSTTTNVFAGSTINDTATLTNATNDATGTVAYTVYTNNVCTTGAQSVGVKTVANAVVPNSDSLLFNNAGTFYWQAVYSGDQHNAAASSSCGSEVLTVVATTTPPVIITPTPGAITGTVFNDINQNNVLDAGDTGLSGFTIWLHSGINYNGTIVQTTTTDGSGHYGFSNLGLGTYFVEEQGQSGFNQTSNDMAVTLASGNMGAVVNFANVAKGSVATSTNMGHGKKSGTCDGDNDKDDMNCSTATSTATTTPGQEHGRGIGQFIHDFVKAHFENGHDNGNHGTKGKEGKDN